MIVLCWQQFHCQYYGIIYVLILFTFTITTLFEIRFKQRLSFEETLQHLRISFGIQLTAMTVQPF